MSGVSEKLEEGADGRAQLVGVGNIFAGTPLEQEIDDVVLIERVERTGGVDATPEGEHIGVGDGASVSGWPVARSQEANSSSSLVSDAW